MASRMDELRMVDPVLTTVVQGYSNAVMVADALFPHVTVSKLKGKIPVFGREAFVVRDTNRAVRAQSNRVPPSNLELISFETLERDVESAIDYLEEEETPDFIRLEQRLARELNDILLLGKEKEAADYVQNTSNFNTTAKGTGKVFSTLSLATRSYSAAPSMATSSFYTDAQKLENEQTK